jgi:hypothetical protein
VAVGADQPQVEQERKLDRHLVRLLVDEVEALAGAVEDGAEVGTDRRHEALGLADRRCEPVGARVAVARERVHGDHFDPERAEHEREHVRRRREAVVDDDPEMAFADRADSQRAEKVGGVALRDARRIGRSPQVARRDATQLAAREVLLDFRLHRRAHLDPRRLHELDPDRLRIARADADVESGCEALGLHEVSRDRGRDHAEVGDVHTGRRDARDHHALDQPAGRAALT